MSWDELTITKPEKSILSDVKPKAEPKAKPKKAEKVTRKVTGYLTETEFKQLEQKLDGRTQAGLIRRLIADWLNKQ